MTDLSVGRQADSLSRMQWWTWWISVEVEYLAEYDAFWEMRANRDPNRDPNRRPPPALMPSDVAKLKEEIKSLLAELDGAGVDVDDFFVKIDDELDHGNQVRSFVSFCSLCVPLRLMACPPLCVPLGLSACIWALCVPAALCVLLASLLRLAR